MRRIIPILIAVAISQVGFAQPTFKSLFDKIDWSANQSEFANQWKNYVVKTELFHNEFGGFTREYILKGVALGEYNLDFYVCVNENTKILRSFGADLPEGETISVVEGVLASLLGNPDTVYNGYGSKEYTWFTSNFKVVLREFLGLSLDVFPNKAIVVNSSTDHKRFQLYPTDNMWIFLELDTVYGLVSLVQYSVSSTSEQTKKSISFNDLRIGSGQNADAFIPGRFELHKTQNMYNFILLDTIDGRTWQVQWSTDGKNDMVIPIKQ